MSKFKTQQATKRAVLSDITRLFDPLGWYAPALVPAKVLIQNLWLAGLEWDQQLPPELLEQWTESRSALRQLEVIKIPRWLGTTSSTKNKLELHEYCDASERAHAAAIYLRIVELPKCSAKLLMAKTKVAPVKTLSIPRLELCGAGLAAKLATHLRTALHLENAPVYAYSDSQVVLAWLKSHPSKWTTIVANRVSSIQELISPESWTYINTHENPADLATRGINPQDLLYSSLWWNGPSCLQDSTYNPQNINDRPEHTELEEKSRGKFIAVETTAGPQCELFQRFSNLHTLIRVTAFILRFAKNARSRRSRQKIALLSANLLKTDELAQAFRRLQARSQRNFFAEEIIQLKSGHALYKRSAKKALNPFPDSNYLLRVGKRLQLHEDLSFNEKHPVILHRNCPLSKLIALEALTRTLHGGPQELISHLTRNFWITHVHPLAKSIVHQCVTCTRHAAKNLRQIMGNLPKSRIHAARTFLASGVDYAGPIALRTTKGRGHKSFKGYISSLYAWLLKRYIWKPYP